MVNKTIFDVAIVTMHNIRINIMSLVKLGVTKPIATIWYKYHFKIMNMKSLSGQLKMEFYQPKSLLEKPREKGETLSTGGL